MPMQPIIRVVTRIIGNLDFASGTEPVLLAEALGALTIGVEDRLTIVPA